MNRADYLWQKWGHLHDGLDVPDPMAIIEEWEQLQLAASDPKLNDGQRAAVEQRIESLRHYIH